MGSLRTFNYLGGLIDEVGRRTAMRIIMKEMLPGMIRCTHEDDSITYEFYMVDENGEEYLDLNPKYWKGEQP